MDSSHLSIEDIIKLLPLEVSYKVELLRLLPQLDLERITNIEGILRSLYDNIFMLRYQQNVHIAISKLPPETPVDETFYKTIRGQTRIDVRKMALSPSATQASMVQVRDQLQQVVAEKQSITSP